MLKRLLVIVGFALAAAACQSSLEPLPLEISVAASRTTAAPGDTVVFVATMQGGCSSVSTPTMETTRPTNTAPPARGPGK